MTNIDNVPVEILCCIFYALAATKRTLANCTLVCRSWMAIAYPIRFTRLTFKARQSGKADDVSKANSTFEDLVHFLSNAYLGPCVLHLELIATAACHVDDDGQIQFYDIPLELRDLERIVTLLPHLQSLLLACLVAHSPGGSLCSDTLLSLHDLVIPGPISTSHLALALSLFSNIDNFALTSVLSRDDTRTHCARPPIYHFTSSTCWSGAAIALRELHIFHPHSPKSLTVSCAGLGGEYKGLVRALGENLGTLHINDIGSAKSVAFGHRQANLDDVVSMCPGLSRLYLDSLLFLSGVTSAGVLDPGVFSQEWAHVVQAVATAPPTLSEVHITFRLYMRGGDWRIPPSDDVALPYSAAKQLADLDWVSLAAAVEHNHPLLQEAHVTINGISLFCRGAHDDFPEIRHSFLLSKCFKESGLRDRLNIELVDPNRR